MEYGIARSYGCVLAAEGLPRDTNTRLESSLVQFEADPWAATHAEGAARNRNIAGYEEMFTHDVEIRLPVSRFHGRCGQGPRQPDVQGEIRGDSPVVLNVWTEEFPAPPCGGSQECLVVNGAYHLAEQEIGGTITTE